jgi:hypothetical protein
MLCNLLKECESGVKGVKEMAAVMPDGYRRWRAHHLELFAKAK